jgi:hypothetical protein
MDQLNFSKLLILAFTIFKPQINNNIILKDKVIIYKQIISFIIYFANNT